MNTPILGHADIHRIMNDIMEVDVAIYDFDRKTPKQDIRETIKKLKETGWYHVEPFAYFGSFSIIIKKCVVVYS